MDEYKQYIYERQPLVYLKIDAGDISEQKALRQRLQCKPFKWFMEHVAFDIVENYPLEEPSLAYGAIRNLATNSCIDTMSMSGLVPLGLYPCAENIAYPQPTQSFGLTMEFQLRERFQKKCWSKYEADGIWLMPCDQPPFSDGQTWRYDFVSMEIFNFELPFINKCTLVFIAKAMDYQ